MAPALPPLMPGCTLASVSSSSTHEVVVGTQIAWRHPPRLSLPEQEINGYGEHDRQDDAGGDRNVDGYASTSKGEIPR